MPNPQIDYLLRLPEVLATLGVSRATWYRGITAGTYPQPVQIGLRAVGWRASEVCTLVKAGIATGLTASTSQQAQSHSLANGLRPTKAAPSARSALTGTP